MKSAGSGFEEMKNNDEWRCTKILKRKNVQFQQKQTFIFTKTILLSSLAKNEEVLWKRLIFVFWLLSQIHPLRWLLTKKKAPLFWENILNLLQPNYLEEIFIILFLINFYFGITKQNRNNKNSIQNYRMTWKNRIPRVIFEFFCRKLIFLFTVLTFNDDQIEFLIVLCIFFFR